MAKSRITDKEKQSLEVALKIISGLYPSDPYEIAHYHLELLGLDDIRHHSLDRSMILERASDVVYELVCRSLGGDPYGVDDADDLLGEDQ